MPPAQLRALHVTFAHADAQVEQPADVFLFVRMADRQPETVAVRVPFRLAVAQAARQVLVAVQQLASDEVLHVEGIRDGAQQLRPEGFTLGQGDAHPLLVVAIRRVPTRIRYFRRATLQPLAQASEPETRAVGLRLEIGSGHTGSPE